MRFSCALLSLLAVATLAKADGPLPMQRLAAPVDAASPASDWSGRYRLQSANATGFTVHKDRFDYDRANSPIRQFPGVQLDVIQDGTDLLPSPAGIIDSGHAAWEIAVQPGRIWQNEQGIHARLPFALLERNANCTHNGVLYWSPGDNAGFRFQISSETCAYLKFDMWGAGELEQLGDADFPERLRKAEARHRMARWPVLPITSISDDYPELRPSSFGAVGKMRAADMSVYGVVIDGRHYRSECSTRHGPYPFCEQLLLPSYSTAKSIVAGLGLMHLERLHPGASQLAISDLVDECRDWQGVTIENAVDMATGRYAQAGMEADEASPAHVEFLYASTHAERISAACGLFSRRAKPGRVFAYHSSDTYVAATAMQTFLKDRYGSAADLFRDLLEKPVFAPLALSPIARQTRRSYDEVRQPLAGWGLTVVADDFARLGDWLNTGNATVNGHAVADKAMFDASMQRDPDDRGLPVGDGSFRYNNGFWAHDIAPYIGCGKPVWVPFMSGYGGISVVLFPNGVTYYYVSDGYTQRWREAATAINKIRNMCT